MLHIKKQSIYPQDTDHPPTTPLTSSSTNFSPTTTTQYTQPQTILNKLLHAVEISDGQRSPPSSRRRADGKKEGGERERKREEGQSPDAAQVCHRLYGERHDTGINVPPYRYRYNMQMVHAHVGRATTPESNTCCPERPAPGKERSSIAIRPTRRPLLFPIRRSLFRTRARRYFPRVPLPTAFATRLSLFLSRVRGALSLSLYSRDRNEVAGLIVIILIGFVNSILRIDRRGVNKEFVVSIRRRNVIRGLIIWYHFISSAKLFICVQ